MNQPLQTYKDRLESLLKDIVMHVVYSYFELKVIPVCNTSLDFCDFLRKYKHKIFHQFKPTIPCCECQSFKPSPGTSKYYLDEFQYELLYSITGIMHENHEKRKGKHIAQYCLCQYEKRASTEIIDLDIILILKLINICSNVTLPGNPAWLKNVKEARNKLSHLGDRDGERLQTKDYLEMRKQLENVALDLAGTIGRSYKWDIEKRIQAFNTRNKQMDDLVSTLSDMNNANMEKNIRQALNQLNVKVDNLTLQFNEPEFNATRSQTNENGNDLLKEINVDYNSSGTQKCIVIWKLKSPGTLQFKEVKDKLDNLSAILDFKIIFVFEGSLILKTITSLAPLFHTKQFVDSAKSFIRELVETYFGDVSQDNVISIDIEIYYIPDSEKEDYQKICYACRRKDNIIERKDTAISLLTSRSSSRLSLARSQSSLSLSVADTPMIGVTSSLEESLIEGTVAIQIDDSDNDRHIAQETHPRSTSDKRLQITKRPPSEIPICIIL